MTATAALETYWQDDRTEKQTRARGEQAEPVLRAIADEQPDDETDVTDVRGRGLVWGVEFQDKARAAVVARRAFELGLLVETSGPESEVVKLLPALTITPDELDEGLRILARDVRETAARPRT